MHIQGDWFESGSSRRLAAVLQVENNRVSILTENIVIRNAPLTDLDSTFETLDNAAVDQLFEWAKSSGALSKTQSRQGSFSRLIHSLERSWKWAAFSVIFSIIFVGSFWAWGLPYASKKIAFKLPISTHQTVSEESFKLLEKFVLKPTELSASKQTAITQRFNKMTKQVNNEAFPFTLHFRQMEGIPNALALPSGDIIITDTLVNISTEPEEIDAVLLHEIGHVLERHGMQQTINASTLSIIASLAFGNVSGLGEIATGLPILLANSSYSRKAETEADEFAMNKMELMRKDPIHLANILLKMEAQFLQQPSQDESSNGDTELRDEATAKKTENNDPLETANSYFSSHPAIKERSAKASQRSIEFRKTNP